MTLSNPRWKAILVLSALLAGTVGWWIGPLPPAQSDRVTGDASLADRVSGLAGAGDHRGLAVARVEGGRVEVAGLGDSGAAGGQAVDEDTAFEIGSVAKPLTGMLLADAVDRGELELDTTLGEVFGADSFEDPQVASVTMAELASHRSGLPRLAMSNLLSWAGSLGIGLLGGDPYGDAGPADVVAAVGAEGAGDKEFSYSNLGFAVLGQAVAERAGAPYADLMRDRVLEPLGMTDTTIAEDLSELPAGHAGGSGPGGAAVEAWVASGYAPCGSGVWSTAGDLARLLDAVIAGTAPGIEAVTPTERADEGKRIGFGWIIERLDGESVTWHNGGTGGFRSYVGFTGDRGVVVLSNTARSVDDLGTRLLGVEAAPSGFPWLATGLMLVACAIPALSIMELVANRKRRISADRIGVVSAGLLALALLLVLWRSAQWEDVSGWIWVAGVALFGPVVAIAVRNWSSYPVNGRDRRSWLGWLWTGLSAATLIGIAGGMVALAA